MLCHLGAALPSGRRQGLVIDGFASGDPEAGPDKGRQEAVKVHVREPRHTPLAARSLSEVTDAHKQKRAGILIFQLRVLVEKISQSLCLIHGVLPRSNSRVVKGCVSFANIVQSKHITK